MGRELLTEFTDTFARQKTEICFFMFEGSVKNQKQHSGRSPAGLSHRQRPFPRKQECTETYTNNSSGQTKEYVCFRLHAS